MPVFVDVDISLAYCPVFSSNFQWATGGRQVEVSPGMQYSRLAACDAVVPSASVETEPNCRVAPRLYSCFTSAGVRANG